MKSLPDNRTLYISTPVLLFLIAIIACSGCKTSTKVHADGNIKLSQPWIFNNDFKKAVYKTDLLLFGNELSGLSLIKKTGDDYRVVFMSEVGLKYLDMEFFGINDSVKIHHLIKLLDQGTVRKMLVNNYRLIFMTFLSQTKEVSYFDRTKKTMSKEYRYKKLRLFYTYDKNFGQVSHIDNTYGRNNLTINISNYTFSAPKNFNFNRPNLNMRMEMLNPE